jgi:hypothetical protein
MSGGRCYHFLNTFGKHTGGKKLSILSKNDEFSFQKLIPTMAFQEKRQRLANFAENRDKKIGPQFRGCFTL